MKRLMLIVAILTIATQTQAFQSDSSMLNRASKTAAEKKDSLLFDLRSAIGDDLKIFCQDHVITGSEAMVICHKVAEFQKAKKRADRHLSIYRMRTTVILDSSLIDFEKGYTGGIFMNGLPNGPTYNRDIFKYEFAKLTGTDVTEIRIFFKKPNLCITLAIFFAGTIIGTIGEITHSDWEGVGAILIIIVIVLVFAGVLELETLILASN